MSFQEFLELLTVWMQLSEDSGTSLHGNEILVAGYAGVLVCIVFFVWMHRLSKIAKRAPSKKKGSMSDKELVARVTAPFNVSF